jgi:hypothetical protein
MSRLPQAEWIRAGLLLLTTAAAACDRAPLGAPLAEPRFAGGVFEFGSWSQALDIEEALPGAHANLNTPALEGCPFIARDGKTLFFASNRPGGEGGIDIWAATREAEGQRWGDPVNLGAPVNSAGNDFCPTLARDGETLYFVSNRRVGLQGADWCGGTDIYVSRRNEDGLFETPRNLGCEVNSAADEFSPFPLPERGEGPVLYFSSTRPGLGTGGDLYRSESEGGVFGRADLVPGVNSAADDGQPNLRRDGLELFFYSSRNVPGALGGNDLYVASRSSLSSPWSEPVNLGPAVNSAASETRPSLSWDGTTLYFGSTRIGAQSDIYVTRRTWVHGPQD